MTSNVVSLHPQQAMILSKKQLAARLDRSTRWVELKVAEGMPVLESHDRFGGRRFDVGAVEAWLALGNPRPKVDRMALLEGELRDLRGRLERLERTAG